jgi:hypothetical protein
MALITWQQIRDFLRQDDIPEINAEFQLLYGIAVSEIEAALGRAIDGTGRTVSAVHGWPVVTSFRGHSGGDTISAATSGATRAALSSLEDYSARYEAQASGWILDVVVDRWKHRVASVSSESGTGGSVTYEQGWLPSRVAQSIRAVRSELTGR